MHSVKEEGWRTTETLGQRKFVENWKAGNRLCGRLEREVPRSGGAVELVCVMDARLHGFWLCCPVLVCVMDARLHNRVHRHAHGLLVKTWHRQEERHLWDEACLKCLLSPFTELVKVSHTHDCCCALAYLCFPSLNSMRAAGPGSEGAALFLFTAALDHGDFPGHSNEIQCVLGKY